LLKGRFLNHFQRWALSYWIYMERRIQFEDIRAVQELQTYELFPERWRFLHLGDDGEEVDGEIYSGVNDPREIDEFLANYGHTIHEPREMVGSEIYGLEV
jgi:hypothetical protein